MKHTEKRERIGHSHLKLMPQAPCSGGILLHQALSFYRFVSHLGTRQGMMQSQCGELVDSSVAFNIYLSCSDLSTNSVFGRFCW